MDASCIIISCINNTISTALLAKPGCKIISRLVANNSAPGRRLAAAVFAETCG